MSTVFRIVWFLLVSLLGFFSVSLIFYGAYFMGILPEDLPAESFQSFISWLFGGIMWAWIAGVAISLAYFFVQGKKRLIFLWAPVYIPVLIAFVVLVSYS